MYTITQKACAKVNLWLNIGSRTDGGYHNIESIMHEVYLFDEIKISFLKSGIFIQTDNDSIPDDNKNTAYKAAELFFNEFDLKGGININIKKSIPQEAGLAGGSTDAACVLKSLCSAYNIDINDRKILKIARQTGSDVPFFLNGKTCIIEGTGENIKKVDTDIVLDFVIIKPEFSISTKWAYDEFDRIGKRYCIRYNKLLKALMDKDKAAVCLNIYNSFESVIIKSRPEILFIKKELESSGAKASLLSGSGSAVFGIYEDNEKAKKSAELLRSKHKNWKIFYLQSA